MKAIHRILCMLLCVCLLTASCANREDTTGTPTTTTTTQTPSANGLPAYFSDILENRQAFSFDSQVILSSQVDVLLSHVLTYYQDTIGRYTYVDMDGDGQAELIVEFAVSYDRLVIRKDGASYYGFLFPYRRMSDIYRDGSCLWSESAFLTGCARLHFDGNRYEWTDLWSEDLKDSDEDEDRYYVNGEQVSKEDYLAATADTPEEVEWFEWKQDTTSTVPVTTATTAATTATTTTASKTETTKKKTTTVITTANAYTAADLFFPLDSASIAPSDNAAMTAVAVTFDDVQRRARMQMPDSLTVQTAQHNGHTYAALYHKDKRVGRLMANYLYPDTVSGESREENTVTVNGVEMQTLYYTAGADTATTYYGFFIDTDNFFYSLEISADYISQTNFAACLSSLQIVELLARDNRLDSRRKDNLRIAIAGNSFISYSYVAEQLDEMLKANHKKATVQGYSYPNISVAQIAASSSIMQTLCSGDYDVLFLGSAYYAEDVAALAVVEEACQASGTELVLFPAHNEGTFNTGLAYTSTNVKLAHWKQAIDDLIAAGIPESDLVWDDGPRHSKVLAGYCGAVMIYAMLYESAPDTAAIGADFSGLPQATAQRVEDLTMDFVRPYYE